MPAAEQAHAASAVWADVVRTSDMLPRSRVGLRFRILGSPVFLLCLSLLLLNDVYLKSHHPGWISGKLSDFSGLMVVALLTFPLFRRHTYLVVCVIALAFTWWKSPLSEPLLDFINGLGAYQFGRVVDYSDLLALSMLPMAAALFQAHEARAKPPIKQIVLWPVLAVTTIAISGTSASPLVREFTIRSRDPVEVLAANTIDEIAAPILQRYHCDVSAARRCDTRKFSVEYVVNGSQVSFIVGGTLPLFFSKSYIREADKLVGELKDEFAAQIPGLEYIENLDARICLGRITAGCSGQ